MGDGGYDWKSRPVLQDWAFAAAKQQLDRQFLLDLLKTLAIVGAIGLVVAYVAYEKYKRDHPPPVPREKLNGFAN